MKDIGSLLWTPPDSYPHNHARPVSEHGLSSDLIIVPARRVEPRQDEPYAYVGFDYHGL